MTGTLYTFSVMIRKFWEQVRENEKCYMISIGRVVFSFAFHQVSAGSPHTCWNKTNLVSGPGGERKPKWPQSTCLCSLSSRRLRGRSHSGELILKGTKGKNHPPGFTWNCSLRATELSDDPRHEIHSSFTVKLKFEVCSCLHSPDKMILKKRSAKFKSRAVHEFHVLRAFWLRLVYGALRNISCFSLHIRRLLLLGAPNVKNPSRHHSEYQSLSVTLQGGCVASQNRSAL